MPRHIDFSRVTLVLGAIDERSNQCPLLDGALHPTAAQWSVRSMTTEDDIKETLSAYTFDVA
ncbi:MAG: hypothetical protein VYD19_06710, partial [Myxococcota bacterium]|nr:hypothetical protein [Myxococcota bacterium]